MRRYPPFRRSPERIAVFQSVGSPASPPSGGATVRRRKYGSIGQAPLRVASLFAYGSPAAPAPVGIVTVRATLRLEVYLEGDWEDITTDVLMAAGVQWTRGIMGSGPTDRVADTGTLTFSLWNDGAGVRGRYSPLHANVRAGWQIGVPVKVTAEYDGDDYPQWRGFLSAIYPLPNVHGQRAVVCTAVDVMDQWAESPLSGVATPSTGTLDELVQLLADASAMPLWLTDPIDGELVSLDTSGAVYPYAFKDVSSGTYALTPLHALMVSSGGFAYVAKDGSFTTENRHRRLARSSVLTLTDTDLPEADDAIAVPSDLSNVFNRMRVTIPSATRSTEDQVVIYTLANPFFVDAGETKSFVASYALVDSARTLFGAVDTLTPQPSTDYRGNQYADGSGLDYTGDLGVTITPFFTSAVFTIANLSAHRVHLSDLNGPAFQMRGRPIYDDGAVTVEASSTQPYGERVLEIDAPYLSSVLTADAYAQYLERQFNDPEQASAIRLNPQISDGLMVALLGLEIGDVLTVSETMTGVSSLESYVQSISVDMRDHFWFTFRCGLAPRRVSETGYWTLDVSKLDSEAVLGF